MKVVKRFFYVLFKILNGIGLYKIVSVFNTLFQLLYTNYIVTRFKKIGESAFVAYPMNLIGGEHIEVGSHFFAHARLRIEAYNEYKGERFTPKVHIGDNVCFNFDCHVGCINEVSIGNNVLIGSSVLIIDHAHGGFSKEQLMMGPSDRPLMSKGPVKIEDNVWIGEGVAILPGVTIGKNSVIAANAVVTKDVPANSIAAGVPAQIIKSI